MLLDRLASQLRLSRTEAEIRSKAREWSWDYHMAAGMGFRSCRSHPLGLRNHVRQTQKPQVKTLKHLSAKENYGLFLYTANLARPMVRHATWT